MIRSRYAPLAVALIAPVALAQDGMEFVQTATEVAITVDGDVSEWPQGAYVAATPTHVFFRFRVPAPVTLTASPVPVRLVIDVDGSNDTGQVSFGMGVDLDITIADPTAKTDRGPAVTIRHMATPDGTPVSAADVGLLIAPTHASEWFEVRLDRAGSIFAGAPAVADPIAKLRMFFGDRQPVEPPLGLVAGVIPTKAQPPATLSADLPLRDPGAVRVLSWNVLWEEPTKNAAGFQRIIEAVKPDVILFQEWARENMSESSVAEWLNSHAAWAGRPWAAEASEGWGVAVASFHPLSRRGPDSLLAGEGRWDYPVRLAAAEVATPIGTVIFGSVHTKCCGALGTDEDTRRAAEAQAINATLEDLAAAAKTDLVVLGGDFNLVGTTAILSLATTGLDSDGSNLRPALPRVLGDRSAVYTFGRRGGGIPSRLDYVTFPDAALRVSAAFVLDTTVLDDASLAAMNLQREDSLASDHLPVVVDLLPVE